MKKFNNKVLFFILVGVLIFSSVAVYAKSENVNLEVMYRNIKLIVKGKEVQFGKDLQGNEIEPFIHEGVTYLPVRAVAEALGENVEWDQDNYTVIIGGEPKQQSVPKNTEGAKPFLENIEAYSSRRMAFRKVDLAGKDYDLGMETVGFYSAEHFALFNLEGKYNLLTGIVGIDAFNETPVTVKFLGDDKVIHEMKVKGGDLPKDFAIDVSNVHKLEIRIDPTNSVNSFLNIVFTDMYIK